jgi:hypothetical protein
MEQLFIQLIDKTFFHSTKKSELCTLFDTINTKNPINACSYIMTRGTKKNQCCGKPCINTFSTFCSSHTSKQMDTGVKKIKDSIMPKKLEHTCTTILKNGKNKGKPCGKACEDKYCSTHDSTSVKSMKPVPKSKTTELCGMIIKHGKDKGSLCTHVLDSNQSCIVHPPLRVTRYKNYFVIKGTNVLFDEVEQRVIGYKKGTDIIMEENKEVTLVCKQYDLEYSPLSVSKKK